MAARFAKPKKTGRWATSGTRLEPAEEKKDSGWLFDEVPSSSVFNFIQGTAGKWQQWLDERFADGTTPDDFVLKHPGSGVEALLCKPGRLEIAGDPHFALDLAEGNPQIQFFDNSLGAYEHAAAMEFDRTGNQYAFYTSGSAPHQSIVRIKEGGVEICSRNTSIGGGLVVGGIQELTKDFIFLGRDPTSDSFSLQWKNTSDVRINFTGEDDDYLKYDRRNHALQLHIAGQEELRWSAGEFGTAAATDLTFIRGGFAEMILYSTGLNVLNGLSMGFAGSPRSGELQIGDAEYVLQLNGTMPTIYFDKGIGSGNAFISYRRNGGDMNFRLDGSDRVMFFGEGDIAIDGSLAIGNSSAIQPVRPNAIEIGDNDFFIQLDNDYPQSREVNPVIVFDTQGGAGAEDYWYFGRSATPASRLWRWVIAGTTALEARADGLSPGADGVRDLGTSLVRWHRAHVNAVTVYENDSKPLDQADRCRRSTQNSIIAHSHIQAAGGFLSTTARWNVESITQLSTGQYDIVYVQPHRGGSGGYPTTFAGTTATNLTVRTTWNRTTGFRVEFRNSSGVLTNADGYCLAVGGT